MALTRKMLKAMGIEDEKIEQIIDAHAETTDALKAERDKFKADVENLGSVSKELEELKKSNNGADEYKKKYEELNKEFTNYKTDIENKAAFTKKSDAYKKLLKETGISDKRIDSVLRLAKADGVIDKIELDGDNIKDIENATNAIKANYSDYIETQTQKGANVPNPPASSPRVFSASDIKKMSPAEINANWDTIKSTLNSKGVE